MPKIVAVWPPRNSRIAIAEISGPREPSVPPKQITKAPSSQTLG